MRLFVRLVPFILLAVIGVGCVGALRTDKGVPRYSITMARTDSDVSGSASVASESASMLIRERDETGTRSYRADVNPPQSLKEYDKKLTDRVYERWRKENRNRKVAAKGVVAIGFRLGADGNISEVHVVETSLQGAAVDACVGAIHMSAPFDPWPEDIHRLLEGKSRGILVNFRYPE
jgi:hypothetical protein